MLYQHTDPADKDQGIVVCEEHFFFLTMCRAVLFFLLKISEVLGLADMGLSFFELIDLFNLSLFFLFVCLLFTKHKIIG